FQTTAKQSLTLGGGNTGNIILGNNGFTSCSALESINGVITCGTDDVGSAGTNYWQLNSGALSPYNESLDLLLGSAATGSAEFAITGIAAGTPTASISATTNNNGISLTGSTSTIQSLNMGSLTIGGNTTGNVILSGRNGSNTGIYFQGYNCNGANGGALTVDSTGLVQCSADDSSTGAGTLNIKEDNLAIVTGSNDINFLGSDFTVTDQGGNQGGVAIDYNGSGITRKNNAEVIGGQWSFLSDILVGGTSTASAKFAILNMQGSGTPTASISGTGNNALSLDGLGNIGTTNKQTLSLGTGSTGNINLVVGAGNN